MKLDPRDARGLSIGIELVVSILLGLGAGYWLDKRFGTAPWGSLGGIVLGSVAGFRSLFRMARTENARAERADRDEARRAQPPVTPASDERAEP